MSAYVGKLGGALYMSSKTAKNGRKWSILGLKLDSAALEGAETTK